MRTSPRPRTGSVSTGKAGATARRLRYPRERQDELRARRRVCELLVRGCERALLELRSGMGLTSDPEAVRIGLRAAELLEEVLRSWREALATLRAPPRAAPESGSTFTARSRPLTTR
jgi:hypothetical protein